MRLNTSKGAGLLGAVVAAAVAILAALDSTTFYQWQQERMVKRVLAADPTDLVSAGRTLLSAKPGFVGKISPSSSDVPAAIRRLKPTLISLTTNSAAVDFSDVCNPFGIVVYQLGASPPPASKFGRGPRKWIDGLWLYDDGQLETYAPTRAGAY